VLNNVESHGKHKHPLFFAFSTLNMVTHIVAHTKSNWKDKKQSVPRTITRSAHETIYPKANNSDDK
jgi:hypothetical protein